MDGVWVGNGCGYVDLDSIFKLVEADLGDVELWQRGKLYSLCSIRKCIVLAFGEV